MCLGCRENKNKRELIRVVRTPSGEIELDLTGKKAGRGAYICPSIDCFKKAVKSRGLEKSLRSNVPDSIFILLKEKLAGKEKGLEENRVAD
jgi:predicted RNA-binding protein YlxR (DUF448 family)